VKLPTDQQLLTTIYKLHLDDYKQYDTDPSIRETKMYVPINITKVAAKLKTDEDLVFGKLLDDLEHRFGIKNDDGSLRPFFAIKVGKDFHAINFPYMSSVLAQIKDDNKKYRLATTIAIFALLISALSISIALYK